MLAGAEAAEGSHAVKLDFLPVAPALGVKSVRQGLVVRHAAGQKFEEGHPGNGPVDAAIKALKKRIITKADEL